MSMRKIIRTILYIFLAIILLVAIILIHAGLFSRVEIEEKIMGPYLTVYQPHKGGYHKIRKVIDEINMVLVQGEIVASGLSFGHYFDNPFEGTTKIKDLSSHTGVIINPNDTSRLTTIKDRNDFLSKSIPEETYIVIELPFRSEFSKITGPLKVYSKIVRHLKDYDLKMQSLIEIFDKQNSRLLYLSPIPEGLENFDQ